MSDTSERPTEFKPEEGAEVRPVRHYDYAVAPGGLEALTHEGSEVPYRSLSLLAVVALVLAVAYSFFVVLGGVIAFWDRAAWVLILGTIVVPLLSLPVALKFNIRNPLGLLRFAALALAVFYAVPVGVGGLIAFPSHTPWLLPLWTLLFPLFAAGCGLAARLRIQASEDTLTGKSLALWAVGLSLFFALCYTAFYAATYLAIRQQAVMFTDDWIDILQKGDLERGFALTIPPSNRGGEDKVSRMDLELKHNTGGDENPLTFSNFGQKPYVRLLRGSTKANVELVAVRTWGFEAGGYKVQLGYRISTPYWSFPLELTAQGVESAKGEYKGRRWYVNPEQSYLPRDSVALTPEGKQLMTLAESGRLYAEDWTKRLWRDETLVWHEALAAEERTEDARLQACAAVAGPALRAGQKKRTAFLQGEMVKAGAESFWVPNNRIRKSLVDEMKNLFALGSDKGSDKKLTFHLRDTRQMPWPLFSEENGRLTFRYDAEALMTLPIEASTPEGPKMIPTPVRLGLQVVASCPAKALQGGEPEWRVESFELIRAGRPDQGPPSRGAPPPR
jgi:hypothetical protein